MSYKVFLSHSTNDKGLVIALSRLLDEFGIDVFVGEWAIDPGEDFMQRIKNEIQNCDCVLVLLTRNGIRSNWVQQEVGCATKDNKIIIPLVEKGTSTSDLAFLAGIQYIVYDPDDPEQSLIRTSEFLNSLKREKEKKGKTLLVAGGIAAFLLLLFGGQKW